MAEDPRVAQILAALAEKSAKAKSSMDAAAAAARAKIAAGNIKPDVDTGVDLDVPEAKSAVDYDFESGHKLEVAEPVSHGIPAEAAHEFTENGSRILKGGSESPTPEFGLKDAPQVERPVGGRSPQKTLEALEAEQEAKNIRSLKAAAGSEMNEMPTLKQKVESRAMPQAEAKPLTKIQKLRAAQEDLGRRQAAGDPAAEGFQTYDPEEGKFKPSKPLAQEIAEVKPELPTNPLEGQGAMEGKPVESIVDRRGANIARRAASDIPDLSDSQVQSLVDEVRGKGNILSNAEDAAQLQSEVPKPAAAAAEDVLQGTIKRSVPNASRRFAARAAAAAARTGGDAAKAAEWYSEAKPVVDASLKARAAARLGRITAAGAKFGAEHPRLVAAGTKLADMATAEARDWMGSLEGYSEASKLGKLGKLTKFALGKPLEFAAKDFVLPWAAEAAGKFGIMNVAENLGATGRLPERPGQGTTIGTGASGFSSAIDAQTEQINNLMRYNDNANKFGLKVTGRTGLAGIVGIPYLNRLVQRDPKIDVQEDPSLRAAYMRRRFGPRAQEMEAKIQGMRQQWASQQAKGHSD